MGPTIQQTSSSLLMPKWIWLSALPGIPGLHIRYPRCLLSQETLRLCTILLTSGLLVALPWLVEVTSSQVPAGKTCTIELLSLRLARTRVRRTCLNRGIRAWESKNSTTLSSPPARARRQASLSGTEISQSTQGWTQSTLKNKTYLETTATTTTPLKISYRPFLSVNSSLRSHRKLETTSSATHPVWCWPRAVPGSVLS